MIHKNIASMRTLISQSLKTTASYAFVSMNIKNFESINFCFGSSLGDDLLQQVLHILQEELHENEGCFHTYANEFELWLYNDDTHPLQDRLYHLDDRIYHIKDERIHQSIFLSFGIYIPQPSDTYEHMRICANFCRVQSKDSTKLNSHFEIYNDMTHAAYKRTQELILALRKGFVNKQFYIVLQPKVYVHNKQIYGCEALLRWQNEHIKDATTQELVLLSEQNGFIRELDLFIFEEVCKLLQTWYKTYHTYVTISVNVSRYHFEDPLFFQHYLTIFESYHVPAHFIEFEITETAICHNSEVLQQIVEEMHRHGFQIALDDFGSGFSSLSTLLHMRISTLKIDRIFFLYESRESRILVKTILQMARELHITTVCEGIETHAQEQFLKECKADMIQSYLYYPPLSIQHFAQVYFSSRK